MNSWVRRLYPPLDALDVGGKPASLPISIVVLARDEERCISRCLDSVVGHGFDRVIVADSGSVDTTLAIVDGYRNRGVQTIQMPWRT